MKRLFCILWLSVSINTVFGLGFNYGEIKSFARRFALDNNADTSLYHFTDVLIGSYTNAGQIDMCNSSFCLEGTTTYTLVSGKREYNFESDMIAITRITLDNVLLPQKSIAKLDDSDNWESVLSSSTPSYYYIKHTTYSVIGFDVLPNTTYTKMKVQFVKQPTALVNNSDIPFDGQSRLSSFHFGLVFWTAAMICYEDNREADGDRFFLLYQRYTKNMETGARINPDYVPSQNAPGRNIIGQ